MTDTVTLYAAPLSDETSAVTADTSNRELDLDGDGPMSEARWVLVAKLTKRECEEALIFMAHTREELTAIVKARRFVDYTLQRVRPAQFSATPGDPRERSICNMRGFNITNTSFVTTLVDEGFQTLGEVCDAGPRAMREIGIGKEGLKCIRSAMRYYGLSFAPAVAAKSA